MKSLREVPVGAESMFGGPPLFATSSECTVLKSILYRVRPEVLGTVECSCAPEKRMTPPALQIIRIWGSSSMGSSGRGCLRVSDLIYWAAFLRPTLFHS